MDVRIPIAFVFAFALSGAVMAQNVGEVGQDMSATGFRNHALPVLVRVDKKGHVTEMQPAVALRPNMRALLRKTLDKMITSPAMQDGHAINSQFVMQLALTATRQADGTYQARFAYVSMTKLPDAPLHWVRLDGGRLALSTPQSNDDGTSSPIFVPAPPHPRLPAAMPGQNPSPNSAGVHLASVGGSGNN